MKGVPTFDSDAFTKTDESLLADHEWIELVKSVDGVDDQPSSSSSYSYTGILSGKSESVKRPNFLSKNATSGNSLI